MERRPAPSPPAPQAPDTEAAAGEAPQLQSGAPAAPRSRRFRVSPPRWTRAPARWAYRAARWACRPARWARRSVGGSRLAAALRWVLRGQRGLLAAFIAAGVAETIPRISYLAGRIPAARDSASYTWGFWWVARQVTHLRNPWFTSHMAAPVGVDLGFHSLMPLPDVLMIPVTLLFGPGISYNLMVAVIPGLLCYAMYRAARLWLTSGAGAIAAGAFFGLSSMLTQQDWYHLNIAAGALFLPVALEASVRLRRSVARGGRPALAFRARSRPQDRPRESALARAIILGAVMAAAVLTDQESSVLAAIVVALVLVPWLLRRPSWARLWPAALAAGVGLAVASPQIIAMIAEIRVGGLSIPANLLAVSYKQYGIGLPGMFTPTPRVADFGMGVLAGPFLHGRDNEGMPMFGTVLTVLAILGLIAARRRRGAWLLGALWVGCAALALGTSLWIGKHQYLPLASDWHGVQVSDVMPYTWFVRIPGLSSFREADRLAILGLMPAALLAGAAVEWARHRRHATALIAVIAVFGLLEAGYSGNYPGTPRVGTIPVHYALDRPIAADHSGSIVLDLPFGLRGGIPVRGVPFFPQALVMATQDGHPRSIAYTSRVPLPTIKRLMAHPFYSYLVAVEHQVPRVCPWALPPQQGKSSCPEPSGVAPLSYLKVTPAQLTAARLDATRMGIGWAVVWKRNNSVADFIRPYLLAAGFRFDCLQHNTLVYRHTGRPEPALSNGTGKARVCG